MLGEIQEMVDTLHQHANDDVMLDAFWQWASSPTSYSAGYALEGNHNCIKQNLKCRYELTAEKDGDEMWLFID